MPTPWARKAISMAHTGVEVPNSANAPNPSAISSMPAAQVTRVPNRATASRARGAKTICAAAIGRMSSPARSAL